MNRDALGYIAVFSLISIVGMVLALLLWGVNNDYMISELYNFSETIESQGMISENIFNSIDDSASRYSSLINYFDWYWLAFYVVFIGSTITMSYFAKDEDEFSFLTLLFYGTIILLFLFSLIMVLTDWFSTEIMYKIIPNLRGSLPKFDTWLNNAGIITFIHMLFCIIANKVNLNLSKGISKKGIEFTDTDEVL